LSYLQQFPVDTLKVDRSFISRIQSNPEDMEIVRAVVLLAHSLGMEVVAEGVELPEQLSAVEGLHCEFVQGFYFSRPLNADKMREIINGID
jgi:EAL domain-containing protein (putative c-di-GMP-specific phosphodiesterase class I)